MTIFLIVRGLTQMTKHIRSQDLFKILQEHIDVPDEVISMTLELNADKPVMVTYTEYATLKNPSRSLSDAD